MDFRPGTSLYRRIALSNYEPKCAQCGAVGVRLCVHHLNHNRKDNRLENLQVLCYTCHRAEHPRSITKGWKLTAAQRANMQAAALARAPDSPETRAKKSASAMGKPKSAEHRAHISAGLKGRKRSQS